MDITKDKKVNLELSNLTVLYQHYKDYFLPLGVILACVLIVFFVVIPQLQQYFSLQEQLKNETQKLAVLKSNYFFLTNLDDAKSNSNLSVLSLALPQNKDFAGIMNAISYASAKVGVSVGDFEFSVGELSGADEGVTSYPSIKIDVSLVGSVQDIIQFVAELYKTAPVNEATSVKISGNSGNITVLFYYKTSPSANVDDNVLIPALSTNDNQLIKDVSLWNNVNNEFINPLIPSSSTSTQTASSSGSSTTPF